MTKEEAIKLAEKWAGKDTVHIVSPQEAREYHTLCLSALKEQIERENSNKLQQESIKINAGKKEELIELLSGYSLDTYEDIVYTAERLIEHGVEIPVRCKGCKYRAEYYNSGKYVCTLWQCGCCGSADYVKPDDFCSYGKRKDGDG